MVAGDRGREAGRDCGEVGVVSVADRAPCSYCSTQHRKNLIAGDDRVISWIRGAHNGGAIPLRHFLSAPRVINDTYGLFFYDPDGGYVAAYKKDYGYEFYGWRRGVMVIRGRDGYALVGVDRCRHRRAAEGEETGADPQPGDRLVVLADVASRVDGV